MEKLLLVTIDTEEDSPSWQPEYPYGLENIKAIPRLQVLFDKYGVKPVYLVTYAVANDSASVAILRPILESGRCEIGAHLHPWTCPPFTSERERLSMYYPNNLSSEREKLVNLTKIINDKFGRRPVSYRGGRYGFDEESRSYLEELGYQVDTSVSPSMNWSSDGGPNFSNNRQTQPYNRGGLLEVPISIVLNKNIKGAYLNFYCNLSSKFKGLLKRLGLIKTLWLRPSTSSLAEMKFVADKILTSGNVLTMMFHSNELMSGKSPYIRTEAESEEFYKKLDGILYYLISERGLVSQTLSELKPVKIYD